MYIYIHTCIHLYTHLYGHMIQLEISNMATGAAEQSLMCCDYLKRRLVSWQVNPSMNRVRRWIPREGGHSWGGRSKTGQTSVTDKMPPASNYQAYSKLHVFQTCLKTTPWLRPPLLRPPVCGTEAKVGRQKLKSGIAPERGAGPVCAAASFLLLWVTITTNVHYYYCCY